MYLRVCKKYEVSPEPEFQEPENDSDDEDKFSKYKASEEAIEAVKALPKKEGMHGPSVAQREKGNFQILTS